ncbi:hypothetical protein EV361DRAFT_864343 [Lentinula raphanica]|nr:hypothetical protein EV361DRAFT_864343 [Lentinula raphanica]
MRPFSLFPNELLHVVIDYVAYAPVTPELDSPFKTFFKQASPDLLALSLANWRLRLACLRFLFAHIKICNDNIEKLVDHHALLSKFPKSLLIEFDPGPSQMEDQIIYRILPQLERPLCVELNWTFDSRPSRHFFLAIRGHPIITTVLVNLLPHKSMHDGDLSKVILAQATTPAYGMSSLSLRDCLTNGMGLACLELYKFDTLDEELGIRTFPGLEELRIWMEDIPLVTSWLPVFSSTHRALKKVWFLDDDQRCFAVHTPTFISSFDEETRREGLEASYTVKRIGLRRDIGHSSQEWYVMGLALSINTSLVEILMLVASSFPKLEDLSLDLGTDKGVYDIVRLSGRSFFCTRTLLISQELCTFTKSFTGSDFHLEMRRTCINCDELIIQVLWQNSSPVQKAGYYVTYLFWRSESEVWIFSASMNWSFMSLVKGDT